MSRRLDPLLGTLVLIAAVTAVVSSLGAPLVPAIASRYDVQLTAAQWSLTATFLAGAVATPVLGRYGQGARRRPTILVSLAVVTTGTLLSAVSFDLPSGGLALLVAGRTLQGLGLALVPLTMAVARDALPPERVTSAVSVLSVAVVAGAGIGYPVTAVVADLAGLSAAYYLGTGVTALALLLAVRHVPAAPDDSERRPVDWVGAPILSGGTAAVLLAASEGETWGWTSAPTLALGALGPLAILAWVLRSLRRAHPLVDLRLAVRPGVLGPNLVGFAGGVGMYAMLTLVMVLAQADPATHDGWGLDASVTVAATMLVPYSLLSVGGSRLALLVARTIGRQVLLPFGCSLFAVATAGLAVLHGSPWAVLGWMALGGLGSGFTFSSLPALMLPHLPASETSSALALNQLLRYLGMSVGSSLSVALMEVVEGGRAGEDGYRAALLASAGLFVLVGVLIGAFGRRSAVPAPAAPS